MSHYADLLPGEPIYINGRFLAQNLTGVQRFATEITAALHGLYPDRLTVLAPALPGSRPAHTQIIGTTTGQLWEQFDLPRHTKDGILLNLGNTAPLRAKRQIVVIHDAGVFRTPNAYSRKFRLWYKFLHRRLAAGTTRIVTISKASRNDLAEFLRLPPERITVIPEGADHMARIAADHSVLTRNDLRAGRYVLAVGTLAAHKNLGALNVLADRLAARGLTLAITGAFGGQAFANGGQSALPRPAKYLGRVSDAELKSLYENAGCFVFPSLYEGFGLPAVEAMACGCAVIAANIEAMQESCGDAAIYGDPLLPDEIADAVMTVMDNENLRAHLRQTARDHVRSMTWANAAAALSRVIQLMETPRPH